MFLDDRKRKILKAIIDDYINTAEPIGSRTIARKHELGLSSATIRNEMADLEELGFLAQPHTSAGRIPSDKGYRFYVDELLDIDNVTLSELESIKQGLEIKISEVEMLIKAAAAILAKTTNYITLATSKHVNSVIVKALQLVWIEEGKLLVVLVVNGNIVKNILVKLSRIFSKEDATILSNLLNERIRGVSVYNVPSILAAFPYEEYINNETYKEVCIAIIECINQVDAIDYFLEGTKNILNFPEFKNVERAKLFLDMLDKKDIVCKLLEGFDKQSELNVQIGQENEIIEVKDCSLIITNYSIGHSVVGSIGIIGPTRMEYGKVISYMNYLKKQLDEELKNLIIE
jgi:heat-inducible transcriptional repressor